MGKIARKPREYIPPAGITHYFTKAVGVTFKNRDGTSRQKAIRESQEGERLGLMTGTHPKYPYAVALVKSDGRHIGHLEEGNAREVHAEIAAGLRHACILKDITGGYGDKENFGVNIVIIRIPAATRPDQLEAYVSEHELAVSPSARRYDNVGAALRRIMIWTVIIVVALIILVVGSALRK